MPYIGKSPGNGVRQRYIYAATAGQTSFSGNDSNGISLVYDDAAFLDVYQNGVLLKPVTDYASTTGTSVVLTTGASTDDVLEMITYDTFAIADTVSAKDGGSFAGNMAMGGTLGVTGAATLSSTLGVTGITTATGGLNVGTIKDAGNNATAMTVDSTGRILTPARPAFHARLTSSSTEGKTGTLVFNTEDFDIGGNYDTSNGRFTAPIAGIYYFVFDGLSAGNTSGAAVAAGYNAMVSFIKNGSEGTFSTRSYNYITGGTQYNTLNRIDCIQLAANDYVQVKVVAQYIYVDATNLYGPTFQGFLLG